MAAYVDIISFPDHEDLGKWYFEKFSCSRDPAIAEKVKESANLKGTLERYYARYEERFPHIRDPRKLKIEHEHSALQDGTENQAGRSGSS